MISDVFLEYLKKVENGGKTGWSDDDQLWYSHASPEGGNDTIGYGHKLLNSELEQAAKGLTDNEIDDLQLNKALSQSRLTEVVEKLPDGLNTMLGERGIRLSGGQRQRIALARAFYHERNVIIMDEATSSIDNETEQEIIEEIKLLKGKKTIIVIAHRLTTLQYCDRIYRLEKGSIIEQGTYKEVIQTKN